ncbi:hypothetical protein [Deinococcus multiflagellatus]|uniref:Uncharacterized protein n=1 Tax=Deinococcus multiflagellatus TaxID=1656887 RepID=A0ABW1ZQ66_9DEIO|nr:hypothetical protein [Deinococcus multiflagellatus]MBZ9715825.1 hypothetical protein [Deinococcus multiflagellatus]
MTPLTLQCTTARAVLETRASGVLLVVHATPHPGSSSFIRQLSRNPLLQIPQEEEAERRMVESADAAVRVLQRHGILLTKVERQQVDAVFEDRAHAAI